MTHEKNTQARINRLVNSLKGQAIVEFTIILPVLILIMFGVIEFGRMMMVEQILASTARAGVREAVLSQTTPTTATIKNTLITNLTAAGVKNVTTGQVVFTPVDTVAASKDAQISLTITVPFSQVSWLNMIYQNTNLTGTCTMRKE